MTSDFRAAKAAIVRLINAAIMAGDDEAASRLSAALLTVETVGGWRAFGRALDAQDTASSSSSGGGTRSPAAERAARYRARKRDGGRDGAEDLSHVGVTARDGGRDVLRDASRLTGARSLSQISEEEGNKAEESERDQKDPQAESTREGERVGAVTRDALRPVTSRRPSRNSVTGPEHPAGDLTLADWAEGGAASVAMATGRKVGDVRAVWAQFVAHLSAEGRPITRAEWTRWVTREVNKPVVGGAAARAALRQGAAGKDLGITENWEETP